MFTSSRDLKKQNFVLEGSVTRDLLPSFLFITPSEQVAEPDPPEQYDFLGSGPVSKVGLNPDPYQLSNDMDLDPTKNIENKIL